MSTDADKDFHATFHSSPILEHPTTVAEIIQMSSDGILIGLVMKLTGGSASPATIQQILNHIREL